MNVISQSLSSHSLMNILILFVLASLTNGVSTFKGISELKGKESSRAHEMKKILNQIGCKM